MNLERYSDGGPLWPGDGNSLVKRPAPPGPPFCAGSDLSAVRSYVEQHALLAAELDVSQLYIRTSNMSRTVESGRSARDIVLQRIQSGVGQCSTSKFPIRTGWFAA